MLDADAARALAWLARGKPSAEIVSADATPPHRPGDFAGFRRAA